MNLLYRALDDCPLIAILRGITPVEAADVGHALLGEGFRVIEVPLNSPEPFKSIEVLQRHIGEQAVVGAGTVMTERDVVDVKNAGGSLIVMPHADFDVIGRAKAEELYAVPGIATPTEAFATLSAGADALKVFPAEMIPPAAVKAMLAVLPHGTRLIPVGGIGAGNILSYRVAGASAFGIGSSLYAPGKSAKDVATSARALLSSLRLNS
jgi:2-dehydro-3-deoxyphosphogalactonate aldolase